MFAVKYKPTTQKSLFHKDITNHIRKWIKMNEELADDGKLVKNILFLYGPIGCSKTVTVECLFKGYNLIEIDSDMIRSSEKMTEIFDSLVNFRELTLANIDKWNHKNNKEKSNIILIDNLELCDKGIESFIEGLYVKRNVNIPIIMICNSIKYKDLFINYSNCTFLEFKKPSLLELSKLSCDITKAEKLDLSKDQIKKIIDKSEYDIRQLLFLLEQWSLSKTINSDFEIFLENIQIKNVDIDLLDKMKYLCNYSKPFDFNNHFTMSTSEPLAISNSMYQNYLNNGFKVSFDKKTNIEYLNNISNVMDNISISNMIHNEIYENQNWGLYNTYTSHSSVLPSYYIKKNNVLLFQNAFKKDFNETKDLSDQIESLRNRIDNISIREFDDEIYKYVCFKDISYNFINSYEEVKKISNKNIYSRSLDYKNGFKSNIINNPLCCFTIVQIFIKCIENLNVYFNKNKKGKNTTKREKLELCKNIEQDPVKKSLDTLVDNIYEYKLFEIDIDDFLINKSKYKDDAYIQKIDLRVFKRLLNIFTMDDKHKNFKSHIETSIQYKILQKLLNEYDTKRSNTSNIITQDLNTIWNLG
jgi:DNA polymerase III delta prime subunit